MAGGFKSLLAFWLGRVGRPPASSGRGGKKSLLAFWVGGASGHAAGPVTRGGKRSMLAPWIGGASGHVNTSHLGGMPSFFAFWLWGGFGGTRPDVICSASIFSIMRNTPVAASGTMTNTPLGIRGDLC